MLVTNKQQSQKGMSLVSSSTWRQSVLIIGVLLSGETSYCSEYDSLSPSIDADIGYMEHTATPTYAVAYRKQVR